MKPGRELDALIAEKVMGWAKDASGIWRAPSGEMPLVIDPQTGGHALPRFSTEIADAWLVVERLKASFEDGFTLMFDTEEKQWRAGALWWRQSEQAHWWEPKSAIADTAPLAICLAALEAVK